MQGNNNVWYILGLGAIGCLFAGALLESGAQVIALLRSKEKVRALSENGGVQLWKHGTKQSYVLPGEVSTQQNIPIKRLLVATKAHQTCGAIGGLDHRLNRDTTVFLLQNGLGVYEQLRGQFPHLNIFNGVTTEGANKISSFEVVHAGLGTTALGSLAGSQPPAAYNELSNTSLNIEWAEDINRRLLHKLGINCCINALTAIYRCTNGELLDNGKREQEMTMLAEEVASIYRAADLPGLASSLLDECRAVATATAENRSSMLQDVESGKGTEIEYMNGYLVRLALSFGIDCPHNRRITAAVQQLTLDKNA